LVDKESGTDENFRRVAHVVMHEYAHSWSGNRVTVAAWHQLPLKEAFTEFRSMMFMEHFFSEEIARIDQINSLRERQFPDDESPLAHPIHMDSYISPDDNYDATTYTKGSEVFRMLSTILGDSFREAQNAYFDRYAGQAVTFRELLTTLSEVSGVDLSVFERWFHQVGTPRVKVNLEYDQETHTTKVRLNQSCLHPKTKVEQEPFHIPLNLELISRDGKVLAAKHKVDFTEKEAVYTFTDIKEKPIPLFLHGLSAPVKWDYSFSDEELASIILYSTDAFWKFEAAQVFAKKKLAAWVHDASKNPHAEIIVPKDVVEFYRQVIVSEDLSPMAKAHVLAMPSLRSIAAVAGIYDFQLIQKVCEDFKSQLATQLEFNLLGELVLYPNPGVYDPYADDFVEGMKVREYRGRLYSYLLAANEEMYVGHLVDLYWKADNFHNKKLAVSLLANTKDPRKMDVLENFYQKWKDDKGMLNHWMTALTSASNCTIETLEQVRSSKGYDSKNPNHIRSVLRVFANNPACFHDPDGSGYAYLTDKVIEVAAFNPYIANGYIAQEAYLDYRNLPEPQKSKMREQLERLRDTPEVPARVRETATNFLTEGAFS
jgi:aminopeptidase N